VTTACAADGADAFGRASTRGSPQKNIIAGQPHRLAIEVGNLPSDGVACLEQRLDRGSEFWPRLGQLGGTHGKRVHLRLPDEEPEILEEPADLVLNIPLDLDEQSSAHKQGFDRVAVEIFDADLLVPSTLHHACKCPQRRSGRSC